MLVVIRLHFMYGTCRSLMLKLVRNCCLRHMNNLSAISWREQDILDDFHFVISQQTFLLCQFTETTVCGQTCRSTWKHYHFSERTCLRSFSLMLLTWRKDNKYQFHSPIFDQTRLEHYYTTYAVLNVKENVVNLFVIDNSGHFLRCELQL